MGDGIFVICSDCDPLDVTTLAPRYLTRLKDRVAAESIGAEKAVQPGKPRSPKDATSSTSAGSPGHIGMYHPVQPDYIDNMGYDGSTNTILNTI